MATRSSTNHRQKDNRRSGVDPLSSIITPREWNPPSQASRSGRTEKLAVVNEEVRVLSLEEKINGRQQRQPSFQELNRKRSRTLVRQESSLTKENRIMKDKNKSLTEENKSLIEENEGLKQQLAKMAKRIQDLENQHKTLTLISKEQEKQLKEYSRLNKEKKKESVERAEQKKETVTDSDVRRKQDNEYVAIPVLEPRGDPNQPPVRTARGYYSQDRREDVRERYYPHPGYHYPSSRTYEKRPQRSDIYPRRASAYWDERREWWDKYNSEREYTQRMRSRRMEESRFHDARDPTYHRDLRSDDTPPNPNLRNSSASAARRHQDWGHPLRNSIGHRWEDQGRRESHVHPNSHLSDGQRSERGQATSVPMNQRRRRFSPAADEFVGIALENVEDMRSYNWILKTIRGNFADCDAEPPEVNGGNAYIFFRGRADTLKAFKIIDHLEYKDDRKSWQRLTPILLVSMSKHEIDWLNGGVRRAGSEERNHRPSPREERPPDEPGQSSPRMQMTPGNVYREKKEKMQSSHMSQLDSNQGLSPTTGIASAAKPGGSFVGKEESSSRNTAELQPGESRRPDFTAEPRQRHGGGPASTKVPGQKRQNQSAQSVSQTTKSNQPLKNPYSDISASRSSRTSYGAATENGSHPRARFIDSEPGSRQRKQNPHRAPRETEQRFREGPPGSSVGERQLSRQQHVKPQENNAFVKRPSEKGSTPVSSTELTFKLGRKPPTENKSKAFESNGPKGAVAAKNSSDNHQSLSEEKLRIRRARFGTVEKPILREVGRGTPKIVPQRAEQTGEKGAGKRVKGLVMGPHDPNLDVVREPVNFTKKKKRKSSSRKTKKR